MPAIKGKEYKRFEDIKHIREDGSEYWSARELAPVLEYAKWDNFHKVIKRAMIACENAGHSILDQFPEVGNLVVGGVAPREKVDYELTRYACYLIVQNGDPRKEVIALGQTYFAIQTYRQELDVDDIHNKKGLTINQKILDYMGSTELIANLFRISQTEEKLRKDNIQGADKATQTHYAVGREVRKAIEKIGGTMPEDLPTPEKSIQQIEKEQMERLQKKAKAGKLMLDE
jgi:DNA-damage-inducible protein D